MTTPAWSQQEVKPATPPAPVSGSAPSPAATAPASMDASACTNSSKPEPAQAKFANAPGFVVPAPSFSYTVLSNTSAGPAAPNKVMNMNPPNSPSIVQPPVPGISTPSGPSFSFNVSQNVASIHGKPVQQTGTNTSGNVAPDAGVSSSTSTTSQLDRLPGQLPQKDVVSNIGPASAWTSSLRPFSLSTGLPGTPGLPGPPGLTPPAPVSSHPVIPSLTSDPSPSSLRPNIVSGPVATNPGVQPQVYSAYPSMPPMAANPQALWLQPPQMSGLARPPFVSYPAVLPGSFPFPAHGMPISSMPSPDPQPPGVTPEGSAGGMLLSSVPGRLVAGNSATQTEVQPLVDDTSKHVNGRNEAAANEQLDTWTAHKADSGVVYYYNALTGESTYEKPACFKGELDNVASKAAPISMEKLADTDWEIVTMNDGRKYYYNHKTKLSSWQIPIEVSELRKKQDDNSSKENLSMTSASPNEKGSAPVSLSAPAINTGGRDATALRISSVLGSSSSSALDLIKKKLQESGTPSNSLPVPAASGASISELNGSKSTEGTSKVLQSDGSKDKIKDNGDGNMSDSSSDSEDADSGPTKEERIWQFKEMLKERGVAPFSKWEKELPKILFDQRFKAIPSYSARRSLFEHYVKTRAEEERKERRAAQKAAMEGFRQLLEEASQDIDHTTDYYSFRKKWGNDPRFEAVERKDRENLLNERVLPLKKAAEEKAQAMRTAATSSFKSLLRDKGDITVNSRWSRVKDSVRDDPRYKSVKHEDREALFNEYIVELKAVEDREEKEAKAKREEQEKLKERERELRKRKEREEQEMERVRLKIRRKEATSSFQALLVETIKDPQASWTESKVKLEKDPQGRASNPDLDPADPEKLFREHMKRLHERCSNEFRALLSEVITLEAASREMEDGKTMLNSWSTAKRLLKPDPRYNKMPRKEREALWRRYVEEMQRKQKSGDDERGEKNMDTKGRSAANSGRLSTGSRRAHDQR
ncbi:uncharacterized protein J3R85_008533 [Psidium guajava]|nr:uncharacterized protein J3R85_008533 [Psidium guajava]